MISWEYNAKRYWSVDRLYTIQESGQLMEMGDTSHQQPFFSLKQSSSSSALGWPFMRHVEVILQTLVWRYLVEFSKRSSQVMGGNSVYQPPCTHFKLPCCIKRSVTWTSQHFRWHTSWGSWPRLSSASCCWKGNFRLHDGWLYSSWLWELPSSRLRKRVFEPSQYWALSHLRMKTQNL